MAGVNRIADIEVLRAVAVGYVVLGHADGNLLGKGVLFGGAVQHHFGGWVGVDLFFAISGFVIARSLLPALAATSYGAEYKRLTLEFWGRRALRLLPSAWLWLAIILLLQLTFNDSGVFGSLRANLWASLAAVANVANFRFAHAFASYEYGVSFVYWSLSLEEQFYLLLPVLVFCCRRALPWCLVLLVLYQLPQQRGLYEMMTRSDAIALGILIALFSRSDVYSRLAPAGSRWREALCRGFALGCLLLLPWLGSLRQDQFTAQIGAVALLSALAVLCCSFNSGLLARLPGGGLLVWLGARSYAIYLIHIPAFFALRELAFRSGWNLNSYPQLVLLLALALILIVAEANYRFLETPARELARRWFPRQVTAAADTSVAPKTAAPG